MPEGKHEGVITKIEFRGQNYGNPEMDFDYADMYIDVTEDGKTIEVKYGVPINLTAASYLGHALTEFEYSPGDKTFDENSIKEELRNIFVGRKASFLTKIEKKDDLEYTKVVEKTLKPVPVSSTEAQQTTAPAPSSPTLVEEKKY